MDELSRLREACRLVLRDVRDGGPGSDYVSMYTVSRVRSALMPVGSRVVIRCPGSAVDGQTGKVTALDVTSSDDVTGHAIRLEGGGVTVVPPDELEPS